MRPIATRAPRRAAPGRLVSWLLLAAIVGSVPGIAAASSPAPGGPADDPRDALAAGDACGLLTDAEIFLASGATRIVDRTPGPQPFSNAGCAWALAGEEDAAPGTWTLTLSVQSPGGQNRYQGERSVFKRPLLGGIGDEAYSLLGTTNAVVGDTFLTVQLLNFAGGGARPSDLAARALAWRIARRLAGPPDPTIESGPLCLVTADELAANLRLAFPAVSTGDEECVYEGSTPTGDGYQVILGLEERDTTADDELRAVRIRHQRGGQEATIAGMPAWVAEDGAWVDVGDRVLGVVPVTFLSPATETPSAAGLIAVLELAAPRLPAELARPTPVPTLPSDRALEDLFPAELAGAPVRVQSVTGEAFADQLDFTTKAVFDGLLATTGRSYADMSVAFADLFSPVTGDNGSLVALQVRGADGAALLEAGAGMFWAMEDPQRSSMQIAGRDVLLLADAAGDAQDDRYLYVAGDILWIATASTCAEIVADLQGCRRWEAQTDLLTEIFQKIPGA